MSIMMEAMPTRAFDVGIAEGHAVTFSAGMAADGLQPFCNIYSAFSQRAYDNIIHDTALQRLPVVICLDRAGLVGEDGPTHHGAFDMAFLRPIPHITIASPLNEHELRRLMYTAQLPGKGTFVIRYPRGRGELVDWKCPLEEIEVGTGRKLCDGTDVAVLSIGPIGNNVTQAIHRLHEEGHPVSVAHYDMRFVKPLDEHLLQEVAERFSRIITVEDGCRAGGFGSAVIEWMADHGHQPKTVRLGLPDEFVEHGTVAQLQQIAGIDTASIYQAIIPS
jgi:1-deoxy-D-xylulose-5-phosphate synthase